MERVNHVTSHIVPSICPPRVCFGHPPVLIVTIGSMGIVDGANNWQHLIFPFISFVLPLAYVKPTSELFGRGLLIKASEHRHYSVRNGQAESIVELYHTKQRFC